MADNLPRDSPPPYASLLLTQHIPHLVVIQLYTDPFLNQIELFWGTVHGLFLVTTPIAGPGGGPQTLTG